MPGRFLQTLCIVFFLASPFGLPALDSSYTIREGETLFSIARKVQVPVEVLSALNGIADASKVKVGTVIKVPQPYVVKKGDTLYGIARRFSIPLAGLLDLNSLSPDARIKVGEKLFVPPEPVESAAVPGESGQAVAAAADASPEARRTTTGLVWPHPGRHEPYTGKISGFVFYGTHGDVVHSATAGEVKWATFYWNFGKVVIIKQADGTLFLYGGNEEILVNVGDRVDPGSEIARLREAPEGGGAKLYFSIQDVEYRTIDPEKYFSAKSRT